jgi:hypothetical protein
MTQPQILTTAAAILVSLAATPVFAQTVRAPQNSTHDNSGDPVSSATVRAYK